MFGSIRKYFNPSNTQFDRWLLAALVFALPFERIPSWDITGITIRASLVIGGLVILRAAQKILTHHLELRHGWIERLLVLFCAWLVVLIPFSLNKSRGGMVTVFTVFVITLALAVKLLLRREYLNLLIKALFWSTIIVCLFGIYQYIGNLVGLGSDITGLRDRYSWQLFGFPRVQSTSLEPLYFASFLTLPLSVFLAISLENGLKRSRALVILLGSVDLFLTVSRGGTYAYALVVIALLIYAAWRKHTRAAGLCGLIVIVAYGISLLMISYLNEPIGGSITHQTGVKSYITQLRRTGLESGAPDERAQARAQAFSIFKAHPIFGVGPGNFGPTVQNNHSTGGWVIVNNEPLELLAETGAVGFGLLAAALGLVVLEALRRIKRGLKRDQLAAALVLGLIGFILATVIQYQTFSTLYIVHIWVAIGLLMGITKLLDEDPA